MNGTIILANPAHGRYAVQTEDGDCCAFELLDSIELSIGNELSGNLDSPGSETLLLNNGNGWERFSVYMELTGCDRITALTWARA